MSLTLIPWKLIKHDFLGWELAGRDNRTFQGFSYYSKLFLERTALILHLESEGISRMSDLDRAAGPANLPLLPSLKGRLSPQNTVGAYGHQLVSSTPGLNSESLPLSGGLPLP